MTIQETAMLGLAAAKMMGASYVDVRHERIEDQELSYSDGTPSPVENSISTGWAVRVLKNGAWGFASSDRFEAIEEIARTAIEIAEASAKAMARPVELATYTGEGGVYTSPYKIDPFTISLKEKIDYLADLDAAMGAVEGINSRSCFLALRRHYKRFWSSDNLETEQTFVQTGAGMIMGSVKSRRERWERSYPKGSGQYVTGGLELLDELAMKDQIPRLADEIKQLQSAKTCPEKTTTLVLSPAMTGLVIHESVGHALELDRVFGMERNFSGISFAIPELLDNLQYGSELVNFYVDPTIEAAVGSHNWDDEGVKSRRVALIEKGILKNYLSSRETAARIGKQSTSCLKAISWKHVPIVRMTTTVLEPGETSFDDIIAGVDDGIYLDVPTSWSIDDLRKNFQFGCEIGWEIKGGKLGQAIKEPTFSGCTTDFWNNCDAIGDRESFTLWGTPNCGKGQPGQTARTTEGSSYTRFRNVQVGG